MTGKNSDEPVGEQQTGKQREQRLLMIGQACTSVAHDVNNCLQMMFYDIDLMENSLRRSALNAEQTESGLRSLGQSIDKASSICRRLLEFAKGMPIERTTDATRVLGGCQPLFARLFRAPVEVEVDLPVEPLWVALGTTQFEQLVMNLVVNAWQAVGERGRVRIELQELTQAGSQWVRLRVTDSGVGISAAVLPHIFEPYFSTRAALGSVGLGLSLANDLVSTAQGEIQVTSEPGQGSCFTVVLPRVNVP